MLNIADELTDEEIQRIGLLLLPIALGDGVAKLYATKVRQL